MASNFTQSFALTNFLSQPSKTTPGLIGTAGTLSFGKTDTTTDAKRDGSSRPNADSTNIGIQNNSAVTENNAKKDTSIASGLDSTTVNLFATSAPASRSTDGQKLNSPANTKEPTGQTTVTAIPPSSILRGKTIEEIVNKWSSELEQHIREFNMVVSEVSAWDRTLIDNGNTIAALCQHLTIVKQEQDDIVQLLSHIEQQQTELSSTLDAYEKSAKELFQGQSSDLRALDIGPADAERDKNYLLAAELNSHLDDLSQSLLQMIETINSFSDSQSDDQGVTTNAEEPLKQISQILSSHLESLEWIDGAVRDVEKKVYDAEKRVREVSRASPTVSTGLSSGSRLRGFGIIN